MPHVADKVELVQRALNMFETAVKIRLGYKDDSSWLDATVSTRLKPPTPPHMKFQIVGEKAPAQAVRWKDMQLLDTVDSYAQVVEYRLKHLLAGEYDAWEESWLDATVPDESVAGAI